jgi:hypothetical protein
MFTNLLLHIFLQDLEKAGKGYVPTHHQTLNSKRLLDYGMKTTPTSGSHWCRRKTSGGAKFSLVHIRI